MFLSLVFMPFSIVFVMLWAFIRTARIASQVWWEIVMAMLGFYLQLCWNFMVWAIAILTLPLRLFTALYTQIELEEQLRGMKRELENLANENKELEECMMLAFKGRKILEQVFVEMEEEHKKTLAKINLLHNEIQYLKEENLRLSHAKGKSLWDWKTSNINDGSLQEGRVILQDIMTHGDQWGDDGKGKQPPSETISVGDETFEVQKIIAIRRSLFSTVLSFLVGLIIWEAEDPCMPLVAALFTVVGMSISSVVQFFSTIKNKPASDAVALLSINCFMLGTLTCPTLPRVAVMWAPWAMRAFGWLFGCFD